MKKYHVYGIGNALVDMEFEVTPDFLKKMNIEKGLMTLVEKERQVELLEKLGMGQHKRTCGGSAANTIIAIAQMGGKSFYSCKVAHDEPGDFYFKDLESNGVTTNLRNGREGGVTGKCMVLITPDADRTMNTYLGITQTFSKNEIVEDELANSDYLYIEGYLVTSETGRQAAIYSRELAQKHNVKTAITFSDPGVVAHFREGFKEIMGTGGVDLLFCNEKEALAFTESTSLEMAMDRLKEVARAFCVTQGPRGAVIFDGKKEIDIVTTQVEAIDTNGAGDLFAGAFLYALGQGHTYSLAGKLACAAASKLVTQFGARLEAHQAKEIRDEILERS